MTEAAISGQGAQPARRAAITVEAAAYVVLLIVALGLRWPMLGAAPLNAGEAAQASAAWHLLNPDYAGQGSIESPLVFGGALLGFLVAGPSNAAARTLPMLAGAALVFSPLLFRKRLGRVSTLIAVGWLAISPGAVAASRQMSGITLSMLALVAALAALERFISHTRPLMALFTGAGLGLALLADSGTLVPVIGLALGLLVALLTDEEDTLTPEGIRGFLGQFPWVIFAAGLLGAILLAGTAFLLAPGGLGAAADLLAAFAQGIIRRQPGAIYPGTTLLLYEPVLLLLGLAGAWRASQSSDPWQRFLAGWGVAALGLTLLYQGALPAHSLWSIVPLTALAAITTTRAVALDHEGSRWISRGTALGTLALVAMMFASFSHHLRAPRTIPLFPDAGPDAVQLPIDLILTILWGVMLIVLWLSIASIFEGRAAWRSIGLALIVTGLALNSGQSWALAFQQRTAPYEPVNVNPAQTELLRLAETAAEVGRLAVEHPYDAPITLQAAPDGALAWALRDFEQVTIVEQVDPTIESMLVITPADAVTPALGSGYVGQDFVITRSWLPRGLNASNLLTWAIYRTAPTLPAEQRVILWVREDIYQLVPAGG